MIELRGITKTYQTDDSYLEVIKNTHLKIQKAEFVSIVGKSGSGKTTLLSLMAGLDQVTAGEVYLDGQAIHHLSEDKMAPIRQKKLGFIFQSFHLVPTLNVIENVMIPAQLAGLGNPKERAGDLLIRVGLKDRFYHRPNQLSGGEQQRVAICRALINNPTILFADEPTGNLDSEHGERVLELLTELKGQRTLVLVTHDYELSSRADRRIELSDGVIVSDEHLARKSS